MASLFFFAMPSLFFLSQLFLWFCSTLSNPSSIPDFPPTVLNHTANLEAINNFMAFDATQLLNQTLEFQSNHEGYIKLPLFDVDIFRKSKFKDYHSLILPTLARDKKSVEWFTSTFINSTKFTEGADLLLYRDGGIYETVLAAGTPQQRILLIVDTGSSQVWWNCISCINCQTSISFDPLKSSTFRQVDCLNIYDCPSSAGYTCETQLGGRCNFNAIYVDLSETSGYIANEKLSSLGNPLLDSLNFGCAEVGVEKWIENEYIGILGFGRLSYSFVNQFNANSFSMCFQAHTSIGGSALYLNQVVFARGTTISVPFASRYDAHYSIKLYGMFAGREYVPFYTNTIDRDDDWGKLIVDSGTRISRFPTDMYKRFRDAFRGECTAFPQLEMQEDDGTVNIFDTCYNVSGEKDWQNDVPPVVFDLGGLGESLVTLHANQIFLPLDPSFGFYCLAFAPISRAYALMGTFQLAGTRVSVDLVAQYLNFDYNEC